MTSGEPSLTTSLLCRLRQQDPESWRQLAHIFGPLVYHWCRRDGCPAPDAADVTQEVFRAVHRGLEEFRYERQTDSFRGWLATITRNKIRDHARRQNRTVRSPGGSEFLAFLQDQPLMDSALSADLADRHDAGGSAGERLLVVRKAMEQIQNEFEARSWQMFWRATIEQQTPADLATEFGVSVHAVYQARSRILRRLRELLDGLL